jgi:hypothetical protein
MEVVVVAASIGVFGSMVVIEELEEELLLVGLGLSWC